MSSAIPVQVALVDSTGRIDQADLQEVAGALNEQVQADFAPVWKVRATCGIYAKVPPATWQVVLQAKLDEPGALGYHTDTDTNQPISFVEVTADWPATVSHELLEMLADAYGNRMHSARLPEGLEDAYESFGLKHPTSRVHYLLEVCDPCEATSYDVGGVPLSDFLLPSWYRSTPTVVTGYSHAEGCKNPREVADGGYVSFANSDGEWFQCFNERGELQVSDLGKFSSARTLREFSDARAREHRAGPSA
jgi:hypothetical protein